MFICNQFSDSQFHFLIIWISAPSKTVTSTSQKSLRLVLFVSEVSHLFACNSPSSVATVFLNSCPHKHTVHCDGWLIMLQHCDVWLIMLQHCFFPTTQHPFSGPHYYRGFTFTLRHTTLGSTLLDELSARRRDLYLTSSICATIAGQGAKPRGPKFKNGGSPWRRK
jgi:hypothetical protein